MNKKLKLLKRNKLISSILLVGLVVSVIGLTGILLSTNKNIKIGKLVSRVSSLNASVVDADANVNAGASYDELTYKFNINKDESDEAIIIGTLTDAESKYARFKETSNSEVTNNGKQIVIRTTSSKPKIIVIVTNAPYGEIINPKFTINSENPDNKNIITDPVTITSSSIEGTVKDEKNNLIGGLELSLTKDGEEIKRTYNDSDGKYVFSLPEEGNYGVKLEEEKYQVIRQEELTTNDNKRILNIIVKEVTPFTLDINKTINKLDLVLDGKKETTNYNDESRIIKNIKRANTIEGSIYYKIYIKNIGDVKGSLTLLKDILHDGLSFDESKNPGWKLKDDNLYYTILDGKDIDVSETVEVNLVLDIEKTNEAKNYINEVVGKGETFKNVVYILDNNIYKEEYVIEGEIIDNITPTVENFGGWYTDKKHTNKYNFNNEVTKNLILYGKIENNKYDVTFIDKNPSTGQETIIETKVINEGETVDFPTNIPEHVGYTFKCFTLNDECINELEVREDTTLYTDYTVNNYTINYDYDGGSVSEDNPETYTVKDEITLYNPTKEGYTFLGWTGRDVTEPTIEVTIPRGSTGNRSYTAHFEIKRSTLTINPRGGSYQGDYGPIYFTEDYGTIMSISDSERKGYTFKRYNKVGGGIYNNGVFTFNDEDAELNAIYEIDTYTISYDNITPEERETISNPVEYNVETETFELTNPADRVDEHGNPSEDFIGWDDGNGNVSQTVTIEQGSIGNRTYTAVWRTNQNEYRIRYELHGGEYEQGQTNPTTYTRETETFTLNKPSKTGYDFIGWTGTVISEPTLEVTIEKGSAGDKYYEANYSPITYTISYDNAGGTVSGNPESYTIESNEITLINPSKNGYIFDGWSGTGITGTSKNVKIPTGSTGERSYVAHFTPDTYRIDYELNGGSATNPSTYTIESNTITLNNPTKTGYTFTGWSGTDLVGDDNQSVSIPTGSIGDRSYEAHYSLDTYTITYDYNEGALDAGETNPATYTYESETITFKTPKKTGYTFRNYTLDDTTTIIDSIPTHSTGNKKLVANYDIDRFNIYFYNGEELFGSELVDYNTTVTPLSEDPTKAHHIFLYWSEDGTTPYDYDTLITEDKYLYAVYEEVVSPTISFSPSLDTTTNKTWTCDNTTDENCGVTVTITPAANDYETYYKVGDGSYVLYTEPFKVYNNETVSAFSKKSNISSVEVSDTINNIDKINPTIDETSFEAKVAAFSIKLTGNIVDNESGIKYYELYILDQDRDLLPSDLPYTTSDTYPGDHEDVTVDFKFTGLQNLTEYKMFVKAYDYVGNSQLFSIKAETTDYVARIIGRGNIPYSDESQWEKFESLQDAIDSCEDIQCTIQLNPEVVNESVEINEYQDITLDIDNKLLTSSGDYTVKVNEYGKFTLIDDSNEHSGKITNTLSKAIINNGRFTLGSGSTETLISLPTEYPIVEGAVIGLDNYGTFYFFDGYVKANDGDGHSAAVDNTNAETITQYPYNVISTKDGDMLVESLKKVDDPEARIKSVYYTKLNATAGESAIPSSNNGTYENENVKLLSQIKQYGEYGFIYNPNEDSIISSSNASYNSQAISYVKVDLTSYNETQYLLLNTSIVALSGDYGYVAISETYGDLSNKVLTLSGIDNNSYRILELEPKKTYYIYFGFVKNSGIKLTSNTYFKVNSANIVDSTSTLSDIEILPNSTYYFEKQADGSYVNTNNPSTDLVERTTAYSYALFDLTNVEKDINLTIYYKTNIPNSSSAAFIDVSDNIYPISYSDSSHRVLSTYGNNDTFKTITLTHGQKNFVHFGLYRYYSSSYYPDTFTIDSLALEVLSNTDDITEDNIHHNVDDVVTPETNEGDQYYFEYLTQNPFVWKNSVDDKNNVSVYGAHISENNTYYSFSGNSYASILEPDITLTDYEESVFVEYSTTSSSNMVLYGGSNQEKIAIGFHDSYIIVSAGASNYVYPKPTGYNDGEKHSLFVTYKEGSYELYYDGVLQEHSSGMNYYYTNSNIYIGSNRNVDYYFNGNIYQVRIFDSKIAYEDINNTDNLIIYLNPNDRVQSNIYVSNNNRTIGNPTGNYGNTSSHSYLVYDLTHSNKDMRAVINYSIESENDWDIGYILVNNTPDMPSIDDTNGRYVKTSGSHFNQEVTIKLKKNQVNYVHFYYVKDRGTDYGMDSFIINSVKLYDSSTDPEIENITTINHTRTSESIFNLPVAKLNEDPSTVVMLKDVTTTSTIEIPEEKQMILDLNGHTLSSSVADFLINNKGNLTITDGKYSNDILDLEERYEEQVNENQEKKEKYEADLAEYEEYAGLCEGCEPSDEYILDQMLESKFEFTGEAQEYTPLFEGDYLVEVWGASGGKARCNGSLCGSKSGGGYSKGIIHLDTTDKLYIYVGEEGSDAIRGSNTSKSFNGGGLGTWDQGDDEASGAGGGATDIRLLSGDWNDSNSLASRIMVAGAGGGSSWEKTSGYGGGLSGGDNQGGYSKGATQTTGYLFGVGKDGEGKGDSDGVAGGGGGYYGGVSYNSGSGESASGGSGYISGHLGSVAISAIDDLTPRLDSNNNQCTETSALTDIVCSYHYSGTKFTETEMKSGNEEMPTHDGKSTMIGNIGGGYAKITALNEEQIEQYRQSLPKRYNVKTKPVRDYYETESGKLFIPFHEDYLGTNATSGNTATIDDKKVTLKSQATNSLSEVYHINKMGSNIISGEANVYYQYDAYGTLYVGFASTPDLTVDDYIEYKTFDVRGYNNRNIDFTVKYNGEEEVYFKIILKSTNNRDTIIVKIDELYFDTYNTAANYAGLAGNITSGSYNIFLNNTGATLNIDDAILNINKASASAIVNRGKLTLGEMATINVNAGSAKGIYNETTGTIEQSHGKINVIGDNAQGIKNSSLDNSIDDLNIKTTKTNQIALNNSNGGTNITFDNLNIYGSGTGLYNLNDGDVTILNSSISSTGNNAITFERDPSHYKFVINSSSIYGTIGAIYQTTGRDIIINNCNLYSTGTNISFGFGKLTIRDSYLENLSSDSYNIYNSGNLYVYDSTINGTGSIIYNEGNWQASSYAYIENSTLKMTRYNYKSCVYNYGTMELVDTTVDTTTGNEQYGITNGSTGYLTISGNSSISSNFIIGINNEGHLKIGTSSNRYKDVYNYDYTGGIQEFTVPKTGNYKIEAWGAQGGYLGYRDSEQYLGSNGAYTSGEINLTEGEKLYINVGSAGVNNYTFSHYNISSKTYLTGSIYNSGGLFSGGATDISLSSESNEDIFATGYDNLGSIKSLRSEESYLQRIMVAGGGAEKYGSIDEISVGQALSNSSSTVSQVTGYAFGYSNDRLTDGSITGGSGYFGGNSEQGGTSYISGYLGAVAMDGSASNPKCSMEAAASDITCSYHNSGKIFNNAIMLAGNEEMPTHDGRGTMKGNFGHGFVKITYLDGEATSDTVTNNPKIGARDTAIKGNGIVEYLDGEITAPWALNTAINKVPVGYGLYYTKDGNLDKISLKSKDSEPYVAQIGQVKYTSLDTAINAAQDGDEIDIIEDIREAKSFDIDKNITIDYNGHSIHSYNTDYLFKNNAKLKLYDSTSNPKENAIYSDTIVYNNGELELNNLKLTDRESSKTLFYNKNIMTMDNVTLTKNAYEDKVDSKFLFNEENAQVTINNSTLNCNSGYRENGTFINNYGELNIKNSSYTFNRNWLSGGPGIINESTGTLTLDNITEAYSGSTDNILVNKNITTIKNSTTFIYVSSNKGFLTLEGNNFTDGTVNVSNDSLLNIKSGTYSNTFNINGTGKSVDQTGSPIDQDDNSYSVIMEDGTINKTLNLNSSGLKWIKGGSIIPNSDNAINNTTSAKLILGVNDGVVELKENTKPIITGNKYAIYTSDYDFVIDFYDGILTGEHSTDAIFETTETGYQIHRDYENDKEIEYLKREVMFKDIDTDANYYSTNEVNDAITNGMINSGDTLQVQNDLIILELNDPIEIPIGLTLNFDLSNHLIEQDDEELFINNGTLIIDDSEYQTDHNNGYGKMISKHGEIIQNNGTLTINAGEYEGERHSIESTIIENNGTLTINDGTYTKYYDYNDFRIGAYGSIIDNKGTATVTGGSFYVSNSFTEQYVWRRVDGTSNFTYLATIFKNENTGTLNVTGGSYSGITEKTWYDRDAIWRTDYYYPVKGQLIDNYGTATFTNITSDNSHIGLNEGTLTFDNVTMNNINNINDFAHPNLINRGDLVITDSNFETHASFVHNTGNMDITNTTIDRVDSIIKYCYYSNGTCNNKTIYRTTYNEVSGYRNSFVILNTYNSNNDNQVNITNSTIINNTGEAIENNGLMNINNSSITSINNNAINNNKDLNVYGNSTTVTSAAIGINNASTATLNLGKLAIIDSGVSQTYPLITGETYGISNAGTFNFYDGYIRGKTHATYGPITTMEVGYSFNNPSEAVDGYNVAYLDQIKVIKNVQIGEEYFTIAEAVAEASSGDTLQMISNDNVLNTAATIVIDKHLTLDLNGYTINQGNNILFRNESIFTINDSNTSVNNQGKIVVESGTIMLDNFGDLVINGGTYNTLSNRIIIKNEALTAEEINNNVPLHTVTLQNNVNMIATDNTILVENNGKMDIYNGTFLKNVYVWPARNVIVNKKELNVVDLNKDDDPNTSSNLTAPWIYSQGNTSGDSGDIYNASGAILNIYGGIFNNGGTYDQGSIAPDQVYIVYNDGTANIKNLDNYSFGIMRNHYGTASIKNSHFYNTVEFAINCNGGTISIEDTIFEMSGTRGDLYGTEYEFNLNNATLDNVTIANKTGVTTGKGSVGFYGTSIVRNSNITVNNYNSISVGNHGTLTVENSTFNNNHPFSNTGTINFVNSTLTSASNGFTNENVLNVSGSSSITSTNGLGINNTKSTSIINLGTQDGVVDVTVPLIVGTTYGIDNSYTGAKINFYDGLVEGEGGPTAINGVITTAEGGYIPDYINNDASSDGKYQVKLKDGSASVVIIAKVGNISFSSQSDPYVTATEALQLAINTAANSGRGVDLLQDITIDQNLTSSSAVTVYRNGHTETFEPGITATNITFTNGQAPLASLAKLLSNVSGSGDDENNIVIYEMNDGSSLTTTKTYKLYLEDNLIGLDEEEAGIYSYRGNTEELKPIKGKIYINNLTSGNYKLKSSDNKELDFSIDNDGNITGNIKKYNKTSKTAITTAIAELIIAIQTGMIKINYIIIIIPIVILIIILLLIVRKKNKKVSN